MADRMKRRLLLQLAAGGALGAGGVSGFLSRALAAGDIPGGQGVARLQGTAMVDGKPAKVGTAVKAGARIETGPESQAVVVVGGDAFLLRSRTVIEVRGRENALSNLIVASGQILSVFSRKPMAIKAGSATIGIRGTGAYLEVDPKALYFCLCYGEAVVEGPKMDAKTIKTTHHESPVNILEDGGIMRVDPAGFRNHTDAELVLLESLVGREPPFTKDAQYPANKY